MRPGVALPLPNSLGGWWLRRLISVLEVLRYQGVSSALAFTIRSKQRPVLYVLVGA